MQLLVSSRRQVPASLENWLGIALAERTPRGGATAALVAAASARLNFRARPQRLPWASRGTMDPHAWDVLYDKALAGPMTRLLQGCRMCDNADAFIGGLRMWRDTKTLFSEDAEMLEDAEK